MPTEVEIKAGPSAKPEDEAISRMIAFLTGIQQNSRSVCVQLEQFKTKLAELLEANPSSARRMARSEAIQRFIGDKADG